MNKADLKKKFENYAIALFVVGGALAAFYFLSEGWPVMLRAFAIAVLALAGIVAKTIVSYYATELRKK